MRVIMQYCKHMLVCPTYDFMSTSLSKCKSKKHNNIKLILNIGVNAHMFIELPQGPSANYLASSYCFAIVPNSHAYIRSWALHMQQDQLWALMTMH